VRKTPHRVRAAHDGIAGILDCSCAIGGERDEHDFIGRAEINPSLDVLLVALSGVWRRELDKVFALYQLHVVVEALVCQREEREHVGSTPLVCRD